MRFTLAFIIVFGGLIFSIGSATLVQNSLADSKENPSHKYYYDSDTGMYKIKAGGGGPRVVMMKYYPSKLEIKQGDTVKWYNPTGVPEPHTVTFMSDSKYATSFEVPFSIKDPSELSPLPNDLNSEPLIIPLGVGEQRAVIAFNARALYPYIVSSNGTGTNLGPNASYVFDGTEKYVNSGLLLPKAFVEVLPGSSDTFTVKFEEKGTFQYACLLHPWMAGQITVS